MSRATANLEEAEGKALAGGGTGAVQRELKTLAEAGLIRRIGKGRQVYYQANTQCAVFPELKSLIMKTAGMGDALKMALLPLAERIRTAFIYGSVCRQEQDDIRNWLNRRTSRGKDKEIPTVISNEVLVYRQTASLCKAQGSG